MYYLLPLMCLATCLNQVYLLFSFMGTPKINYFVEEFFLFFSISPNRIFWRQFFTGIDWKKYYQIHDKVFQINVSKSGTINPCFVNVVNIILANVKIPKSGIGFKPWIHTLLCKRRFKYLSQEWDLETNIKDVFL